MQAIGMMVQILSTENKEHHTNSVIAQTSMRDAAVSCEINDGGQANQP